MSELREIEELVAAIKAGAAEKRRTMQPNECPACGAFRLDGAKPQVHERGCPYEPDWHPAKQAYDHARLEESILAVEETARELRDCHHED